jgi:nitrate reductase cytochrome c-type subunit
MDHYSASQETAHRNNFHDKPPLIPHIDVVD